MLAPAKGTGIVKSVVHCYCELFGIQPHPGKTFKLSTDPYFAEKVQDIVGLPLQLQFSRRSNDFVNMFMGQHTTLRDN
jgi:hypothetical protein